MSRILGERLIPEVAQNASDLELPANRRFITQWLRDSLIRRSQTAVTTNTPNSLSLMPPLSQARVSYS
jgi:hypothetical protein